MANLLIERVIALDLRSRKFGYVIFEGPRTLLDWGIRTHLNAKHSLLERRLRDLSSMFAPSIVLVRRTPRLQRANQSMIPTASLVVKRFARREPLAMRVIDYSTQRAFFSESTKVNKHDIARIVADRFPELSWRLPPKRKPWQSEPTRQSIFDAASLGIYYFQQQKARHL